jgi:hypothetical protein
MGQGAPSAPPIESFIPRPESIEDTELAMGFLADLTLKLVYYRSDMAGIEISQALALPFVGVMERVLEFLKREELVEISGSKGFGERGYQWIITGKGSERAIQALDRDQYIGPAPVPLERYNEMVLRQSMGNLKVGPEEVKQALSHLVLRPEMINKIGPARRSLPRASSACSRGTYTFPIRLSSMGRSSAFSTR